MSTVEQGFDSQIISCFAAKLWVAFMFDSSRRAILTASAMPWALACKGKARYEAALVWPPLKITQVNKIYVIDVLRRIQDKLKTNTAKGRV